MFTNSTQPAKGYMLILALVAWMGLLRFLTLIEYQKATNYAHRQNLGEWWQAGHKAGFQAGERAGESREFRRSEYNWSYRISYPCAELWKHGLALDWPACTDIDKCFYDKSCPLPK